MENPIKKQADSKRRGPEPERIKLEGDWAANVKKALAKKRPPGGFPKEKVKGK